MQEIHLLGSEGGAVQPNAPFLPLSPIVCGVLDMVDDVKRPREVPNRFERFTIYRATGPAGGIRLSDFAGRLGTGRRAIFRGE